MHFEGSSQFRTLFGAFITLIVYVLILINALNIVTDFVNQDNQTEINRRVDAKLSELGPFSLVENDLTLVYWPIDPKVGQLKLYQYTEDFSVPYEQRLKPIPLGDCEAHRSSVES